MSRSFLAKILLAIISILVGVSFYAEESSFKELKISLEKKGELNADELIDYALYSEMRYEAVHHILLKAIKKAKSPLNKTFSLLYIMESPQLGEYADELRGILEDRLADDKEPLTRIEYWYALGLIDKLNINSFIPAKHGYIDSFYASGPYIKNGIIDIDEAFKIEQKGKIEGEYKTFYGKYKPTAMVSNVRGWFNLDDIYDRSFGISYFLSGIKAGEEGTYYLHYISQVPSQVFIDGEKVFERRYMDLNKGVRNIIELELGKGEHTVMVKADGSYNFEGYFLESGINGFMMQVFDGRGDPVDTNSETHKKGKLLSHSNISINDTYADEKVSRKAFKLANVLMNYGIPQDSYKMISAAAAANDSPIDSFFAGYICSRFPLLGFRNYSYNFYLRSNLGWSDNYTAQYFMGLTYLESGNFKEARKYIYALEDKIPSASHSLSLSIARLRYEQEMAAYSLLKLKEFIRNSKGTAMLFDIYDILKSAGEVELAVEALDKVEKAGIFNDEYIFRKLDLLISSKKMDDALALIDTVEHPVLKKKLEIMMMQAGLLSDERAEETLKYLLGSFPMNMHIMGLAADHYLQKGDHDRYLSIREDMLKKFSDIDDEMDRKIFGTPLPKKVYPEKDPISNYPLEIIEQDETITFFKDLSYRKLTRISIRVNNQKGVTALTNFNVGGDAVYTRVTNPSGREYYFHEAHGGELSLKGLLPGSIIDYVSISYYSRKFMNIYYTGLYPAILKMTIPFNKAVLRYEIPKGLKIKPKYSPSKAWDTGTKASKKASRAGYKTYTYTTPSGKRLKVEEAIPAPYTFLPSLFVNSGLDPEVFLKNFYFEIFTDKLIPAPILTYFDSFPGSEDDKVKALYDDLSVNYTEDTESDKDKSLLNIYISKKAGQLDKMRLFKAALEYWSVPHKFLIFSGISDDNTGGFFPEKISGQGLLVQHQGEMKFIAFSQNFIPIGGEVVPMRAAYLTSDGKDYELRSNLVMGGKSGFDIEYFWDLDTGDIDLSLVFRGEYSAYKSYMFDEKTSSNIGNQIISGFFPYVTTDEIRTIANRDNEPLKISVKGRFMRELGKGTYELPFKAIEISGIFGIDYPRKMPLLVAQPTYQRDVIHIKTEKKLDLRGYKEKVPGAYDYDFQVTKTPEGYRVERTVSIYSGIFYPSKILIILKKAEQLDKKEEKLLRAEVK